MIFLYFYFIINKNIYIFDIFIILNIYKINYIYNIIFY